MTHFISIGHRKQTGKDTFARALVATLEDAGKIVVHTHYAGFLKTLVSNLFDIPMEHLTGDGDQRDAVVKNRKVWDMLTARHPEALRHLDNPPTARQVVQVFGTTMREHFPGIWLEHVLGRDYGADYVVLSDMRFAEEAEAVRRRGGHLIQIRRTGFMGGDSHRSERELDSWDDWDYVVHNTSIDSLKASASVYAGALLSRNHD